MRYTKEQIKELILTDYLDGRLNDVEKNEVDERIKQDPELREYLQAVRQLAVHPFEGADGVLPHERVWSNIKRAMDTPPQPEARSVWEELSSRIRIFWEKPRLSFTLASAMTVLIIFVWVGVGRFRHLPVSYKGEKPVEYLMFLSGEEFLEGDDMNNGFGTSIENYFL